MKTTALAIGLAAAFAAAPALACPMVNQNAAQTTGLAAAGMMCGKPMEAKAQSQPGQAAAPSGGCSCCRTMAMMKPQPGQPAGPGSMPGMETMPGMQHPPAPPSTPPEPPKPN